MMPQRVLWFTQDLNSLMLLFKEQDQRNWSCANQRTLCFRHSLLSFTYIHMYIYIYMYVCTYVCMYVCMYVLCIFMYVWICIYKYYLSIYLSIYRYVDISVYICLSWSLITIRISNQLDRGSDKTLFPFFTFFSSD